MEDDGIVRYGYRPSLVAAPQDFAVEQSGLRWSIGRHSGLVPYAAIRRVRLAYRPVSLQLHRFTMEIWADAAPKLTVSSSSWRTMVEQQRQDAPYKAFVRALHDRIARSGAEPRLQAGLANFAFWPGAIVFAGMAIALPWMILKSARADTLWGTLLVGLLTAGFLWHLGGFFTRNRPQVYTAAAIPPAVLPNG